MLATVPSTIQAPAIGRIASIVFLSFMTSGSVDGQTYDGHWWMRQTRDRQLGFLSGYLVCRRDDLQLPAAHHFRSVHDAVELLKWRYWKKPDRDELVLEGMLAIRGDTSEPPTSGQEHSEKYGFYDGMYWSETELNRGFLQGYFACLPDAKRLYPDGLDFYVERITEWYDSGPAERTEEKRRSRMCSRSSAVSSANGLAKRYGPTSTFAI